MADKENQAEKILLLQSAFHQIIHHEESIKGDPANYKDHHHGNQHFVCAPSSADFQHLFLPIFASTIQLKL